MGKTNMNNIDTNKVKLITKVLSREEDDYQKRLQQVCRLRYVEMINEYNQNTPEEGTDFDEYDKYCDHLVVIDEISDKVVGTYRFILSEHVTNLDNKFLTENEFNIDEVKKEGKILELGRACVDKNYRNGSAITLLWKAAIKYAVEKEVRFMVGTASFHGVDAKPYEKTFKYLVQNYKSDYNCYAIGNICPIDISGEIVSKEEIVEMLPPLVKGYMRLGAKISKDAYFDYDFNSTDILIIIDIDNMDARYKARFLK